MNNRLRYADLSRDEKEFITNGCGGKGGWLDPPDWIFHADCDHHDFQYFLGHTEADRLKADRQFYKAMRKDVERQSWYWRWWYYAVAWTYYRAVRLAGGMKEEDGSGKFFFYGSDERGKAELKALMATDKE